MPNAFSENRDLLIDFNINTLRIIGNNNARQYYDTIPPLDQYGLPDYDNQTYIENMQNMNAYRHIYVSAALTYKYDKNSL